MMIWNNIINVLLHRMPQLIFYNLSKNRRRWIHRFLPPEKILFASRMSLSSKSRSKYAKPISSLASGIAVRYSIRQKATSYYIVRDAVLSLMINSLLLLCVVNASGGQSDSSSVFGRFLLLKKAMISSFQLTLLADRRRDPLPSRSNSGHTPGNFLESFILL